MRVIIRPRGTGRTEELIRVCAEAEAKGEVSYIVCSSQEEAHRIFQRSQELKLTIGFPVTSYEFFNHKYHAPHIKNFFIDNADYLLQSLTPVHISVVTMEEV